MIKIEKTVLPSIEQWEIIIEGMRNPMNSWNRSDSAIVDETLETEDMYSCTFRAAEFDLGKDDHQLMMNLANGGSVHAKYRRMIPVFVTITAPLYWWKEFDTYKVGTVSNSCSTMHKIHDKEFTLHDFSFEKIGDVPNCDPSYYGALETVIIALNEARHCYLDTHDKKYWWQMIQLLPASYNQKRTIMLNYEVLSNIYHSRKDHKLDEWHTFCDWIKTLPYSDIITGVSDTENKEV